MGLWGETQDYHAWEDYGGGGPIVGLACRASRQLTYCLIESDSGTHIESMMPEQLDRLGNLGLVEVHR